MRGFTLAVVLALLFAGCGDSGGETTTQPPATARPDTTAAPTTAATAAPTTTLAPTTTAAPTTTTMATTTTAGGPAISLGEPGDDGLIEVDVDADALAPLFDTFNPGDDPFFLVHTQQDDLFVGVELYTVFGDGWTGEFGTFPADCTTHGICVYLDPDGTGPLPGMGPGTGTVSVERLEGGTVVTFDDVVFTDDEGQTYSIVGLTLGE